MFSAVGHRIPHPGWQHFDLDFDDDNIIACQYCTQQYDRKTNMSTLLAHIMVVHSYSNYYEFKKASGFYPDETLLLKLHKSHPGWKYFRIVGESVECRTCNKTLKHVDVLGLLGHLQRAHPLEDFNDFRSAVAVTNSGINRRLKQEKLEPVETESLTVAIAVNNDAIDDKTTISRVVSDPISAFLSNSVQFPVASPTVNSSVNLDTRPSLTLQTVASSKSAPLLPISVTDVASQTSPSLYFSPLSLSLNFNNNNDPHRKLSESYHHLRTVVNRISRKWKYTKKMRLSEFKQPKETYMQYSYWVNGCYKQYYKCNEPKTLCPYRLLTINNNYWLKLFHCHHHKHNHWDSSSSSSSSSDSEE